MRYNVVLLPVFNIADRLGRFIDFDIGSKKVLPIEQPLKMKILEDIKTVVLSPSPTLTQRAELVCGILLTLAAVLFHLTFMQNAGTFWRDEIISIAGISDIWNHVKFDSMPAMFSVALRMWTLVATDSQFSLRLFGFLVGIGILGVLWLNGHLMGYRVPLLAMALFVFNPLAFQIGDSLRPYGLGILLILLTIGLLWKVIEQGLLWQIVAATVVAVLSVQCVYQNAIFLASVIFAGVVVCARNRMWKRAAVLIAIGAVAAVSLTIYIPAIRSAQDWMMLLKMPVDFPYILRRLFLTVSGGGLLATWWWGGSAGGGPLTVWIWGGSSLLATGDLFRSQKPQLKQKRPNTQKDRILFCGTVGVACTIMLLLFLKYMQVGVTPWYFLPLMAIVALSLDGVLGNSNIRSIVIVRIAVALLAGITTFGIAWHGAHASLTSSDKVAAFMESSAQKDDFIIVSPWHMAISFQKYYHGQTRFTSIPPLQRYDYDVIKAQMMSQDPLQPVLSDIAKTLQSGHNVWIVGGLNFSQKTQPPTLPPADRHNWWYHGIYTTNWENRTAYFIQMHGKDGKLLPPVTDKPVNAFENYSIVQIWGWVP